jgi:hypothetical protein
MLDPEAVIEAGGPDVVWPERLNGSCALATAGASRRARIREFSIA